MLEAKFTPVRSDRSWCWSEMSVVFCSSESSLSLSPTVSTFLTHVHLLLPLPLQQQTCEEHRRDVLLIKKTPSQSGQWFGACCLFSGPRTGLGPQFWSHRVIPSQVSLWTPHELLVITFTQRLNTTTMAESLGHAVDGHVQWLLGGRAPIICLQTQLVVTQSCLVKNRQPLHRVCGQGLETDRKWERVRVNSRSPR